MSDNIYQFTLVLKNIDENTAGLEDKLYQAGCDDALINFRNGTVYLEFDRNAASLKDAVISAIKAVENARIGATVVNVAPENWVTLSEIAKRTGRGRQTISLWSQEKRRGSFPKPIMKLSDASPLWNWREIAEWLYQQELLDKNEEIEKARFFEAMNVFLEERDPKVRAIKRELSKEFNPSNLEDNFPST